MDKRRASSFALLAALIAVPFGCKQHRTTQPGTVVILIDRSASINRQKNEAYTAYLRKSVFPALTPGTRVIVEPIAGANTHGDPDSRVIETLPPVTPLNKDIWYFLIKGDMSQDRQCLNRVATELAAFNAARDQLATDSASVLREKESSSSTYLLDGMKEASEALEQRKGRGTLVILSDGLEDSGTGAQRTDFNNEAFWSRHNTNEFVRQLDPLRSAPGLKSANIYFFGMAAGNGKLYESVRQFWKAYFQAAQAETITAGHQPVYGEPAYTPTTAELCR